MPTDLRSTCLIFRCLLMNHGGPSSAMDECKDERLSISNIDQSSTGSQPSGKLSSRVTCQLPVNLLPAACLASRSYLQARVWDPFIHLLPANLIFGSSFYSSSTSSLQNHPPFPSTSTASIEETLPRAACRCLFFSILLPAFNFSPDPFCSFPLPPLFLYSPIGRRLS